MSAPDLKNRRRKKQEPDNPSTDRLPPHSPPAEQGVLACMLLAPNEAIPVCIDKFTAGATVFFDLRHLTIYGALVELYDERSGIDVITLQERLKRDDMLEQVGGLVYLATLPDSVPSAANISFYCDIVQEKFLLRTTIQTCMEVAGSAYESTGSFDELSGEIERSLSMLTQQKSAIGLSTMRDAVGDATAIIESYVQNQGTLTGLATGFIDLDRMTSGLQSSEMIVIAARPSMGKTSFAMNVAEYVSVDLKLPVGVFSLEMSTAQLVLRMICSRARVNLRNLREGFLAERDFPRLTTAMGALAQAPVWIDDTPALSILKLKARMRRMQQQYGIRLFIVDYLQLLNSGIARKEGRQQEIADISSGIKAIAKELKVPIMVLSQLNRDLEREKSRRPRMSDLRESGAIEQDADVVGFLWSPPSDEESAPYEPADAIPVTLVIAKQRNGPTGDVYLTFLRQFTRFEVAARVSDEDLPPRQVQREFETQPDP